MRPDASKKLAALAPKKGANPVIIGAVVAAVLIVGVVVTILMARDSKSGSASTGQPVGVVGGKGGGILANAATVKANAPTVEVYADFQCDQCGHFEEVFGDMSPP